MKKITVTMAGAFAALILGFSGCGTTKTVSESSVNVNVDDEVDKVTVIDWTDRTLGEVAAPQWLKNIRRGNSDTFKEMWGTDSSRVVKVIMATGKTEATAQALSRGGIRIYAGS
ncbi:hypothetical protein [Treponema sp.]|uniref:hypothetical protein n=1 Tax=Treponema sp. TaxID=166 RepID=UPI003F0F6E7C